MLKIAILLSLIFFCRVSIPDGQIVKVFDKIIEITNGEINLDTLNHWTYEKISAELKETGFSISIVQNNSKSFGINIVSDVNEQILAIPVPGSQLWEAGIKNYIEVDSINDKKDIITNIDDFIANISRQNKLKIGYLINGKKKVYLIEKSQIKKEPVTLIRLNSNLIVRITSFTGSHTYNEFLNHINDIDHSEIKNIIIDLRFNSGGDIDEAMKIASHFIKKAVSAGHLELDNGEHYLIKAIPAKHHLIAEKKIVILMSRFTASAAEIFIRALENENNTYTIGEASYGKCETLVLEKISETLSLSYKNGVIVDANDNRCNDLKIQPKELLGIKDIFSSSIYADILASEIDGKDVNSNPSSKTALCESIEYKSRNDADKRSQLLALSMSDPDKVDLYSIRYENVYRVCIINKNQANDYSELINEYNDLFDSYFFKLNISLE